MVNFAELDYRLATHFSDTPQRNLPNWQPTARRTAIPGALATKVLTLTARFAPHIRRGAAAANGTAHS